MEKPRLPEAVKYFVAVLWADEDSLGQAVKLLQGEWGSFDHEGRDHDFDSTSYYDAEMGPRLRRRFFSFRDPRPPQELVEAKFRCAEIEELLACDGKRRVNLDVGYLDLCKVILASAKALGQKIHLDRGIYADFVCRYKKGRYQTFEWSFPDFKDGRYEEELLHIRGLYKQQLQAARK